MQHVDKDRLRLQNRQSCPLLSNLKLFRYPEIQNEPIVGKSPQGTNVDGDKVTARKRKAKKRIFWRLSRNKLEFATLRRKRGPWCGQDKQNQRLTTQLSSPGQGQYLRQNLWYCWDKFGYPNAWCLADCVHLLPLPTGCCMIIKLDSPYLVSLRDTNNPNWDKNNQVVRG